MTTTPNMLLVMPTDHGDINAWGLILNTLFERVDLHTHAAGLGVQVATAGININADLALGTNALTGAKAYDMTPVATSAVTAYSSAIFTNSADGNLYFRNSSGTNVQITSGSTINVSVVGGIGGDYASLGALLDYNDSYPDAYQLRQQLSAGVRQFARIASASIDLYEYFAAGASPVPTQRVRLSSPAALASSYELTFAGALPASQSIVQVGSGGALVYSNVMAANQSITISGTAEYKHGDRVLNLPPYGVSQANWAPAYGAAGASSMLSSGAGALYGVGFPLLQGDRIKSVTFARFGDGAADLDNVDVFHVTSGGVTTSIGNTTVTNPAAAWADTTINVADTTLAAGDNFYILFSANAANIRIGSIRVTYDHP